MTEKNPDAGDFRYDTGSTAVPWAAVAESLGTQELKSIVRFLAKPRAGQEAAYEDSLKIVDDALDRLWRASEPASKLSLGSNVGELEEKACGILKSKHALFMTNATHGFEVAYKYANLGPGDEVIAPSISFIATIAYPLGVGARVVFADLDPGSANMDPTQGGGGSLMDMGGHCIDLLEMFFGTVQRVSCFINNTVHEYESEDSAVATLFFESGAMATVDTFFCIPDNSSKNALEIYGSKGSILATGTIGQGAAGEMTAYIEGDQGAYDSEQSRGVYSGVRLSPEPVNTYCAEVTEFSQAILDNRAPLNAAALGIRNQQVLAACYQSARTGNVVAIRES